MNPLLMLLIKSFCNYNKILVLSVIAVAIKFIGIPEHKKILVHFDEK